MSLHTGLQVGSILVQTEQNQAHPIEFWAEQFANSLIHISDEAAPEIRDQAQAYRKHVIQLCIRILIEARKSDRAFLANHLANVGYPAIGKALLEL